MSVGTAIFAVGMTTLLLLVIGTVGLTRFWRRETDRLLEEGRRIDAEFEEAHQSFLEGARPSKGRFEL